MRTLIAILLSLCATGALAAPQYHAVAMHGSPKYPASFTHFDYVNPDAPKGGLLRRHVIGSFDSFNPFIPRGTAAAGIGYLYDSLTTASQDEPFTQYGLLAHRIEMPEDRSWVIYHLRKEARFADGEPVTAADVVFTFDTLLEKGSPFYSYYYGDIEQVEALDTHRVKFTFKPGDNRELALIVGQLQILPAHYWQEHDFSRGSLEIPLGSGPYRVASFDAGKRVVYERREDYWGKDLPVNRGQYNFDRITFEYFLDDTVALEAFKAGRYDLRVENVAANWATGYQGPALNRGDIVLETFAHSLPTGMQGFVYNLRRPLFQDRTLRKALAYALDFEWTNQNIFHGQYRRTRSYFQNSELAATGLPSEAELKLLEPLREQLPEEVFTQAYQPPASDGSGRPRENLLRAQALLREAGYTVRDSQLYTPEGQPVRFEILLDAPVWERIAVPFARNLQAIGVHAEVRRVDQPQYIERQRNFNFDMTVNVFPQSNSPGNEQRDFWHSSAVERPDSRNVIGLADPAIDALVDAVISARDREELVTSCRALDRALQWGHYVIPNWNLDYFRIAYQRHIAHPASNAPYGLPLDAWWDARSEGKGS
ncbi:extracellular solute-binding protein [Alcanivorax quisquiliarum]|uniref:Extracellular solute-binding protein n=1 Tax=Alcanivorax quisquiliarum TaxID=2933565 RepID=A0ABT0E3S1_9GAMM|nr:extracellular solute-binding protein [Alcanivorax quisquiliarum]MCK0536456.1 extracellular solute-binding protein [Alcanivorax quisquiliarum]